MSYFNKVRKSIVKAFVVVDPKTLYITPRAFKVFGTKDDRYYRRDEIRINQIVAARLKEARELAGLKQYQAADALGIDRKNLKAFEDNIGFDHYPLGFLQKAALVYEVSVDFLLGLNSDFGTSEDVRLKRDTSKMIINHFMEMRAMDLQNIDREAARLSALVEMLTPVISTTHELGEAVIRFTELNPDFDEMLGGAPMVSRLNTANKQINKAICLLVRLKIWPKKSLNDRLRQDLFKPDKNHGLKK